MELEIFGVVERLGEGEHNLPEMERWRGPMGRQSQQQQQAKGQITRWRGR